MWKRLTLGLLASTRRISARRLPYSQVPGPSVDGGGASVECEKRFTMAIACSGAFSEASSSALDTFIG